MKTSQHRSTPYLGRAAIAWLALGLVLGGCGKQSDISDLAPEASVQVGALEGAQLVPLRRTVDFGEIWQGAVREVRFPLMSAGTEPVKIKGIKASCGCTVVSTMVIEDGGERALVLNEDLAPGTRIEVAMRFDSRGRHGRESKDVTVYADIPDGRVRLEFGVDTKQYLVSSESPLSFGRIFPVGDEVVEARISAVDGEPFELELAGSSEVVSGLGLELRQEGAEWVLAASLAADAKPGNLMTQVTLVSDRPFEGSGDLKLIDLAPGVFDEAGQARHYLPILISASVVAPVVATPAYLPFGFVNTGSLSSASCRIECFDPALVEAFVAQQPSLLMVDQAGEALTGAAGEAFSPTWRLVDAYEPGARPLAEGVLAAWDLEVGVTGFSGAGKNRLIGEAQISFKAKKIPPLLLNFQVILQP